MNVIDMGGFHAIKLLSDLPTVHEAVLGQSASSGELLSDLRQTFSAFDDVSGSQEGAIRLATGQAWQELAHSRWSQANQKSLLQKAIFITIVVGYSRALQTFCQTTTCQPAQAVG